MMNSSVKKLVQSGMDAEIAQKLYDNGLRVPKHIREASDKKLKEAGLKPAEVKAVKDFYKPEKREETLPLPAQPEPEPEPEPEVVPVFEPEDIAELED